jgi:hypothetical protein
MDDVFLAGVRISLMAQADDLLIISLSPRGMRARLSTLEKWDFLSSSVYLPRTGPRNAGTFWRCFDGIGRTTFPFFQRERVRNESARVVNYHFWVSDSI